MLYFSKLRLILISNFITDSLWRHFGIIIMKLHPNILSPEEHFAPEIVEYTGILPYCHFLMAQIVNPRNSSTMKSFGHTLQFYWDIKILS